MLCSDVDNALVSILRSERFKPVILNRSMFEILSNVVKDVQDNWRHTCKEMPHIIFNCVDEHVFAQDAKESTWNILAVSFDEPQRNVHLVLNGRLENDENATLDILMQKTWIMDYAML